MGGEPSPRTAVTLFLHRTSHYLWTQEGKYRRKNDRLRKLSATPNGSWLFDARHALKQIPRSPAFTGILWTGPPVARLRLASFRDNFCRIGHIEAIPCATSSQQPVHGNTHPRQQGMYRGRKDLGRWGFYESGNIVSMCTMSATWSLS